MLSSTSSAFVVHLSRQERLSVLSVSEQTAVSGPGTKQWLCRGLVGCLVGDFLVLFFRDLCAEFVRKNEDFTSVYLFPQTQYHG